MVKILSNKEELTFKVATMQDYDDFYKIKCDPENVRWSGFASAPDYERMKEWFRQQLESVNRTIYICYAQGKACGFFYLDKLDEDNRDEMGYGVLTEFSGRGVGTTIVRFAKEECKASSLCAWVSEKNRASERCFEKNGFVKHELHTHRSLAMFNEKQKFYYWTVLINNSFNINADDKRDSSVTGGG